MRQREVDNLNAKAVVNCELTTAIDTITQCAL